MAHIWLPIKQNLATILKGYIRQFVPLFDLFSFIVFFIWYCVRAYSAHFTQIFLLYRNYLIHFHCKLIFWFLRNDKIEMKWIKKSSGVLLCLKRRRKTSIWYVLVKNCYLHPFSILFFHEFTAYTSTFWGTWEVNTTILKPFIRTSWVSEVTMLPRLVRFQKI